MSEKLDIDVLLGEEIKCQCGLYYRLIYASAHYKNKTHINWEQYQKVPQLILPNLSRSADITQSSYDFLPKENNDIMQVSEHFLPNVRVVNTEETNASTSSLRHPRHTYTPRIAKTGRTVRFSHITLPVDEISCPELSNIDADPETASLYNLDSVLETKFWKHKESIK